MLRLGVTRRLFSTPRDICVVSVRFCLLFGVFFVLLRTRKNGTGANETRVLCLLIHVLPRFDGAVSVFVRASESGDRRNGSDSGRVYVVLVWAPIVSAFPAAAPS